MPRLNRRTIATTVLCLFCCIAGSNPAVAADEPDQTTTAPASWLVLGPAAEALPVFHETKTNGYGLDQLLADDRLGLADLTAPQAGGEVPWFNGETLGWRQAAAGTDGTIELSPPPAGTARPAVAWLALYLSCDRFISPEAVLSSGAHPHRWWLDGVLVGDAKASGGKAGGDDKPRAESTKKLSLTTGKHLLLVKTVLDPAADSPWQVGLSLRTTADRPAATCSTDPTRNLDILDILDQTTIRHLAISPDGELVALELSRVLPGTDTPERWVAVHSTRDGRLLREWRGSPAMREVRWAPTGRRLSYVTEEEKRSSLWLADLADGTVRPLLEGIEHWDDYVWSPTGTAVVVSTEVEPKEDKSGVKRLESLLDRQADHRTKTYLSLVTVPDGVVRRLTAGSESTELADIAPDGTRLLFTREIEDLRRRPYTRSEIWQLDLLTLQADKLLELGWLNGVCYAPDGRRLLVEAGANELGGEGLDVPAGIVPNSYDGQLFIWDPADRSVEAITRSFNPAVVEDVVWSRSDGKIYLQAEDRDRILLYRYDPANGSFTVIRTGLEVVSSYAVAEQAPVLVAEGTSQWQPQRLVACPLDTDEGSAEPIELLQPAAQRYAHVQRGEVREWSFTAASGRVVDGRIYLPPGFDHSRRYPAIVYYYGGTTPVDRAFGGRYPKEWWASHGYVVYVPQPSGATGWGQKLSAMHVNDWGETTSEEVIEGTRRLLEEHPFIDGDRVGCIGASYGGFLTMYLVSHTDMYAAAVSHAGISALSSYWGEGYWGYLYGAVANAESFPWNRRDLFVEHSPLFNADKITTPMLLTHGSADPNVPPGESDQLFIALRLLGVPVELLRFAEQEHFILEHDQRAQWSRSIVAWFDRWLKDQPEWWNELYPPIEAPETP